MIVLAKGAWCLLVQQSVYLTRMIKKLIRSSLGNALVGWIIGSIIALLMMTIRWRTIDKQKVDQFMAKQDGIIMVFWHERLMPMPWLWPSGYPLYALQSPHADGRMMSRAIGCFGVKTVWGSSNRNPLSGLRGLKRVLDNGHSVAITPDGPRGPARKAASGAVAIAALSGKPIVPMCWTVDRYWRATGWDRLIIPKPFARGVFLVGAPIHVEKADKDHIEKARKQLETAMNTQADKADLDYYGRLL
jgi:lysophospholipid acyltransferase (LPLAT)-like uncharacterized protein